MKLPGPLLHDICRVLGYSDDCPIDRISAVPVYGGDINRSFRIELAKGTAGGKETFFLKTHEEAAPDFFESEAQGLTAIAEVPGAPRTPGVCGSGRCGSLAFIILEYIETRTSDDRSQERLGRQTALLHKNGKAEYFGFARDNYIGRTIQRNTPSESWTAFFRDRRLLPQIETAYERGLADSALMNVCSRLLERLDAILIEPQAPSLLHGDLWGGNWLTAADGAPVLIDPAVSYGHPEADIAMTELFGGFSPRFYAAYYEVLPQEPGYDERRDLYNLYHLFNHLNMFGRSYLSSVSSAAARYASV
jgi:fructosamine-3-kinase